MIEDLFNSSPPFGYFLKLFKELSLVKPIKSKWFHGLQFCRGFFVAKKFEFP